MSVTEFAKHSNQISFTDVLIRFSHTHFLVVFAVIRTFGGPVAVAVNNCFAKLISMLFQSLSLVCNKSYILLSINNYLRSDLR